MPALLRGKAGRLKNGLNHYSYDSMMHLLRKQLYYGESGGLHLHRKGTRVSMPVVWGRILATFFKHYFLKGLFLFGFGGFSVAFAMSFYVFSKYAFLWEKISGQAPVERAIVPGENTRLVEPSQGRRA